MNTNCPACASDNTQRLEVACAINQHPILLQSAAPPQIKRTPGATLAVWLAVVIALFGALIGLGGAHVAAAIIVAVAALITLGAIKVWDEAADYNRKELPPLIEEWRSKWICLKCGEIYIPRASVPDIRELNRA